MHASPEPKGFFQYLPRTQHDQVTEFHITNIGWTEVEPDMPYPPWQHPAEYSFTAENGRRLDEYQLVYITRGNGRFWSSITGDHDIKAGTIFLLFPGVRHSYSPNSDCGWDEQWFGFNGKAAKRIMENYFSAEHPIFELGLKPDLLSLFEKLQTALQSHTTGHRRIMAITAQEILVRLQTSKHTDQEADSEIDQACQYIEEHFRTPIDFKTYAESTGQSYSTFRRRFKQYTSLAPHKYHLDTKLRNATQSLDNSDLSIQRIAHECGFESPYYFSRYFKAATGLSPKQYRNRGEPST